MNRLTSVTRHWSLVICLAAIAAVSAAATEEQRTNDRPQATTDDVQDLVFLGETRPVFLRLHIWTDGKPFQTAWNEFIGQVFKYLDMDADGLLNKEEADRVLPPETLSGDAGAFRLAPPAPAARTRLETDKDGKVTLEQLADYYRRNGIAPFQFGSGQPQTSRPGAVVIGGPSAPASAEAVNLALFALLDTGKDGRLSKEELASAATALSPRDADDDEMIALQEVVPSATGSPYLFVDQIRPAPRPSLAAPVIPVQNGEPAERIVREMQARYGSKAERPETKTLSQKDLGLDDETFKRLDQNKDGELAGEELRNFAKRSPDLELIVRLGKKDVTEKSLEAVVEKSKPTPLAGNLKNKEGTLILDLGATRGDLMSGGDQTADPRSSLLLRQQYQAQFKQLDSNNSESLDRGEAERNPLFRTAFKFMDRDGDGQLTEKELMAYLEKLEEFQGKLMSSCVSLGLSDQGRGMFDLMDTSRDGRLSVRELRQTPKLLETLDRDGDGQLSRADIPRNYQLAVRRGPANPPNPVRNIVVGGGGRPEPRPPEPTAGPVWFRKMDNNRDGDVSRREFLGTAEEFGKIDTDGDGLINAEEAERADAGYRKAKEPTVR